MSLILIEFMVKLHSLPFPTVGGGLHVCVLPFFLLNVRVCVLFLGGGVNINMLLR